MDQRFDDLAGATVSTDMIAKLICPYSDTHEKRHPPQGHPNAQRVATEKENERYIKSLSVQPVDLSGTSEPSSEQSQCDKQTSSKPKREKKTRGVAELETNRRDPRNAPLLRKRMGRGSDSWHGVGANYWGNKDGKMDRSVMPYCTEVYGSCECKACRKRRADQNTRPEEQGDCFAFFDSGVDLNAEDDARQESPECQQILARGKTRQKVRAAKEEAFWQKFQRQSRAHHQRTDPNAPRSAIDLTLDCDSSGPSVVDSSGPSVVASTKSTFEVSNVEW